MTTKKDLRLAYDAGRALRRADNSTLPAEAVEDPVAACPFPPGDEQRAEWLQGFADAHEQEGTENAAAHRKVADALGREGAGA